MLSRGFGNFISQIAGKTFKENAWVDFVKNKIGFRSELTVRNSTTVKLMNLFFRYVNHFRC